MDRWPYGEIGAHVRGEIELAAPDAEHWVYENKFLGVRNDPVIFPDGKHGQYLSLHAPSRSRIGGVVMLTIIGDKLLFIRSFRHAPRRWEVEAPRGNVDPGESPEASARRELHEECALVPSRMRSLGLMNADTGLFAFDTECFWCEAESAPPEAGEDVKSPPVLLTPREAFDHLASGVIRDGFTGYCLAAAIARGLIRL